MRCNFFLLKALNTLFYQIKSQFQGFIKGEVWIEECHFPSSCSEIYKEIDDHIHKPQTKKPKKERGKMC